MSRRNLTAPGCKSKRRHVDFVCDGMFAYWHDSESSDLIVRSPVRRSMLEPAASLSRSHGCFVRTVMSCSRSSCVCFHSTLFHSCRARGKPTTGSEASVGCNGAVASPKFVPSDSHSSLQSGSILSTCAWSRAAVSLWAPSFLSEAELRLKRSYNNCVAAKATWTKRWAGTFSWRWMFPCFQRQTSSGFMWIRWATSAGYSYIFLLCLCFSHKMMEHIIWFFSLVGYMNE